ncbi:MAG: hypothetical protein M3Q33_01655 [Acidobacteriota bacterium]|nr:hypothetical protein [Acidobacteriota bacterium]
MKDIKFELGQTVEMPCSVCDAEQSHTAQSVTKLGKMTKAVCDVCGMVSAFRRGKKVSIDTSKGKPGTPYDQTHKYRKGQAMMHSTFGQGEVTAVVDAQKIDVLFGDQMRRLVHARQ